MFVSNKIELYYFIKLKRFLYNDIRKLKLYQEGLINDKGDLVVPYLELPKKDQDKISKLELLLLKLRKSVFVKFVFRAIFLKAYMSVFFKNESCSVGGSMIGGGQPCLLFGKEVITRKKVDPDYQQVGLTEVRYVDNGHWDIVETRHLTRKSFLDDIE